jgi:hypothetical protein
MTTDPTDPESTNASGALYTPFLYRGIKEHQTSWLIEGRERR